MLPVCQEAFGCKSQKPTGGQSDMASLLGGLRPPEDRKSRRQALVAAGLRHSSRAQHDCLHPCTAPLGSRGPQIAGQLQVWRTDRMTGPGLVHQRSFLASYQQEPLPAGLTCLTPPGPARLQTPGLDLYLQRKVWAGGCLLERHQHLSHCHFRGVQRR